MNWVFWLIVVLIGVGIWVVFANLFPHIGDGIKSAKDRVEANTTDDPNEINVVITYKGHVTKFSDTDVVGIAIKVNKYLSKISDEVES